MSYKPEALQNRMISLIVRTPAHAGFYLRFLASQFLFKIITFFTYDLNAVFTLATLTATPLRINLQCSLSAVSVKSPWSLRKVDEHGECVSN